MTILALRPEQVSERVIRSLGLDPTVHDAFTPEAIAAALRRAASLLCPATPGEIVDAVRDALAPLGGADRVSREDLVTLLDLLSTTGDLLELRHSGEHTTRLVYLGPPSFVTKVPGQYLLLGVRPEGRPLLNEELSQGVEHERHQRFVSLDPEIAHAVLHAAGLYELRADRWLKRPRAVAASDLVAALRLRLDSAIEAGSIAGLEILDPLKPVRYYRGRWRALEGTDTGDFVGRRPQAYGAAAWCFVRVVDGRPTRLIDLPAEDAAAQARDEAWRLQAAIDTVRGAPQRYRLRRIPGEEATSILDLFGPVPSWAARLLDLVATPVEKGKGALFSYRLGGAAIPVVTALLTDMLWMQPRDEEAPA